MSNNIFTKKYKCDGYYLKAVPYNRKDIDCDLCYLKQNACRDIRKYNNLPDCSEYDCHFVKVMEEPKPVNKYRRIRL